MLTLPLQNLLSVRSSTDGSRHERNFEGIAINDSKSIGLSLRRKIRLSYSPLTPIQYKIVHDFFVQTKGIKCFAVGSDVYRIDGNVEFAHSNGTTCTFAAKWVREIKEYGIYDDNGILWDKPGVLWDDGNVWL